MKRVIFFCFCGLLLFTATFSWADSSETAQKKIEKSYKLYRQGVEVEFEKMKIKVQYKEGYSVKKELERWIKYSPQKEDKIFINFTAPEMDKGLKLLVHRKRQSDLIWLKLPSMHRSRRISGQDEGNFFAETDLTYRDTAQLIGENTRDYKYNFLDSDDTKWTIEALPKESITSIYDKRIFYLNKKDIIEKVLYYRHGKICKTQLNKDIIQESNGRWRSNLVVFVNEFHNRKSTIKILKRKLKDFVNLPTFSQRDLRR